MGYIALLFYLIFAGGCTEYYVIKANGTPVNMAQNEVPDTQLLDIGVSIFDGGVPDDEAQIQSRRIYPDVRKVEAFYIPFQLRRILEKSGHWGAVRTIPANGIGNDLIVGGKIISSDGERLTVNINVRDATGRVWLDREYSELASKFVYRDRKLAHADPFQSLYHTIANDILKVKRAIPEKELNAIRQVAELRFARDFAPQAFSGYIRKADDRSLVIDRLPAENDPMMERIRLIKTSNDLIVDTFDQHYSNFYTLIRRPYRNWRKSSYDEVIALRKIKSSSKNRMVMGSIAVVGGLAAIIGGGGAAINAVGQVSNIGGSSVFKSVMSDDQPGQIHIDALRELSESFEAEVAPQYIEVEGKTITLSGSVQKQYDSWRQMLREFYRAQTGFSQAEISVQSDTVLNGW